MTDLSGSWLGTYWQREMPTRFEATLLQSGNALSGNILDDGPLGEALLSGEVIGRRVSFIKRYLGAGSEPISYTGVVNEDENYIQGQWQVGNYDSGPWEAHRSGSNLTLEFAESKSKRELVGVGKV
ncbi:MAG: hypothetical protein AB4352_07835 [Hormoscilla sp.]